MKKLNELEVVKSEKGVTLVSLLVTLVLSGALVGTFMGSSNIFSVAQDAVVVATYADMEEKIKLARMEVLLYGESETVQNIVERAEANLYFEDYEITKNANMTDVEIINPSTQTGIKITEEAIGKIVIEELNV